MDWKEIKKIDAHIHILPEEKRLEFIKYQGGKNVHGQGQI